jgi:hypothetical protein
MKKRLGRLAIDAGVILVIYAALFAAMAHWRIAETILSPNSQSAKAQIAAAVFFVMMRFFVVLALPGWVLARGYLAIRAEQDAGKAATDVDA